ncbi:MAG: hypothetical protein HQL67_07270 [Magnetococcales bacterium]|nr:hypothetical protein [Magnetococcales bacterium]
MGSKKHKKLTKAGNLFSLNKKMVRELMKENRQSCGFGLLSLESDGFALNLGSLQSVAERAETAHKLARRAEIRKNQGSWLEQIH